jgi:glycosyltransferase involved in cell wall biosynthesis
LTNDDVVSVIIPCYKQAEFLKEAIDSVLMQTYPHFEVIVVDDGSPDNLTEIVCQYPQIKFIRQPNQGAAIARNNGIRSSCGSYVIFLDSDDRLTPNALQIGVKFLSENPNLAFVTGQVKLIDSKGAFIEIPSQTTVETDHYKTLLRSNYIWTPGVAMYRRSIFYSQNAFDHRAGGSADYELNIRIARLFPVGGHGEVILEYRQHQTNMSGNFAYMLKSGVRVRRNQYKYVKHDADLLKAWRCGIRIVQEDVGERLLKGVGMKMKNPSLKKEAFNDLGYLLKYYPMGLIKFFGRKVKSIIGFG